jgi:hypothetical protein
LIDKTAFFEDKTKHKIEFNTSNHYFVHGVIGENHILKNLYLNNARLFFTYKIHFFARKFGDRLYNNYLRCRIEKKAYFLSTPNTLEQHKIEKKILYYKND